MVKKVIAWCSSSIQMAVQGHILKVMLNSIESTCALFDLLVFLRGITLVGSEPLEAIVYLTGVEIELVIAPLVTWGQPLFLLDLGALNQTSFVVSIFVVNRVSSFEWLALKIVSS